MRAPRSIWIVVIATLTVGSAVWGDERGDLTQTLEAAELSFAASVAAKDLEAFAAHIDDQAIFIAGQVLNGKAAILDGWSGFFAAGAPRMEWHPETVVVRPDGMLGVSQGPYTLTMENPDGTESTQRGLFNSIWKRQQEGGWKIIFDSGCPPCPECASQ